MRVVERQLRNGQYRHQRGGRHRRRDAHQERRVVPAAHAVVQPLAVVVEALHALVARAAVLRPGPGGADAAQVAAALLDDVRVLGAVQLGHGLGAARPQRRLGGVEERGGEVGRQVQQQQRRERGETGGLRVRGQRGHQHQEGAHGEHGQGQPARDLQRVQRQLEAVLAPEPRRGLTTVEHRGPWRATLALGRHVRTAAAVEPVRAAGGAPLSTGGGGMRAAAAAVTSRRCTETRWSDRPDCRKIAASGNARARDDEEV